jgi:hypothetical protein
MLRLPALPVLFALMSPLAYGAASDLADAGSAPRTTTILMTAAAAADAQSVMPHPVLAVVSAAAAEAVTVATPLPARPAGSPGAEFPAPSGAMTSGSGLLAGLAIVAWIVARRPS